GKEYFLLFVQAFLKLFIRRASCFFLFKPFRQLTDFSGKCFHLLPETVYITIGKFYVKLLEKFQWVTRKVGEPCPFVCFITTPAGQVILINTPGNPVIFQQLGEAAPAGLTKCKVITDACTGFRVLLIPDRTCPQVMSV